VTINVRRSGQQHNADVVKTQLVDISRKALAARGKQVAAKQILRIAAKKELARAMEKRADGYGGLITAAFFVLEQADTRSWATLPAHVTLVQIPLPAGRHSMQLLVRDGSRVYEVNLDDVDIVARKTAFKSIRLGSGAPKILAKATQPEPVADALSESPPEP